MALWEVKAGRQNKESRFAYVKGFPFQQNFTPTKITSLWHDDQ